MKKLLLLSLLLLLAPFVATAEGEEQIDNYAVELRIEQDSSLKVTETINYDFGENQRHGIFRNIPYKYKARGGNFALRISDVTVTDGTSDQPFTTSKSGGELVLKIGDPDVYVTGNHQYVIDYTVGRAMNYFADHDELYWNAIGTEWPVGILAGSVKIQTPDNITPKELICYTGVLESKEQNCTTSDNTISTQSLGPNEGLTIVLSLPQGTVTQPTAWENILEVIKDNWILVLPVFVFWFMYRLWRKYGRDDKGQGTIVPQYEAPKDFTPLLVGTLVDQSADQSDISAELIYLAQQGYLTITKQETKTLLVFSGTDYELNKIKEVDEKLSPLDKKLFEALFKGRSAVKLSELKKDTSFTKEWLAVQSDTYKQLVKDGYLKRNPQTTKALWVVGAIVFGFGGSMLLGSILGGLAVLSIIVSSIVILIFGVLMPARTAKGSVAREHILGLKDYLSVAEKDRLKFHNAPEKNPKVFETLLPFAMALGVEKQWAKQFEGIYKQNPNWYNDSSGTMFNAAVFSNSISSFSSSMNSAMTTASSGGSGFSGGGSAGGGGGGGGGSW